MRTTHCYLAVAYVALLFIENGVNAFGSMKMSVETDSRRTFFSKVTGATLAAAGSGLSSMGILAPPANAVTGSNKVNAKLQSFGLPPALPVDGLNPVAEIYGKGANRFPLMVTFSAPFDWVVTYPNNDVNGEDGTLQAGDYAKGDTATLFVYTEPGNVKNVVDQGKEFYQNAVIKAISQKGNNIYQNFKLTNVEKGADGYVLVDFKYELLTGAGFEVDRKGVASITSEGAAVEVLWCAVTRQRYPKMENTLRKIASSFRCYADGIKVDTLV